MRGGGVFPEKVLPDCLTRLLVGNILAPKEFGIVLYIPDASSSPITHSFDALLIYTYVVDGCSSTFVLVLILYLKAEINRKDFHIM